MNVRRQIFTQGPWREEFGDPTAPTMVAGVPVRRRLAVRDSADGALVQLADRRFAITGATVVVGPAWQLRLYLRRRARRTTSPAERTWLQEVAAGLDGAPSVSAPEAVSR